MSDPTEPAAERWRLVTYAWQLLDGGPASYTSLLTKETPGAVMARLAQLQARDLDEGLVRFTIGCYHLIASCDLTLEEAMAVQEYPGVRRGDA